MTFRSRLPLAITCLIGIFASACASAPAEPTALSYRAPWAGFGRPDFLDLLVTYGVAHLARQTDETLDHYLRSRTKYYDRYVAALEVGVGVPALKQEAATEIQSLGSSLPGKQYVVTSLLRLNAYDPKLQGFPIFELPFDQDASIRYSNSDVRASTVKEGRVRGLSGASAGYGFLQANVTFSKVGWVLPLSPEQAATMLESLSRLDAERKIAVAMVFTLTGCDAVPDSTEFLDCGAVVQSIHAYGGRLDLVTPDRAPLIDLVTYSHQVDHLQPTQLTRAAK